MEPDVRTMLLALGPGGTTELAERALAQCQDTVAQAVDKVLALGCGHGDPLGPMELGGLAEVCRLLGKSRQTVGHWIAGRRAPGAGPDQPPFPDPIVTLDATPVWDLGVVRSWAADVGLSTTEPVEPRKEH